VRAHASDISSFLVETLPAMKHIQAAAATSREGERLGRLNAAYLAGLLRLQLTEFATAAVPSGLGAIARAGVFVAGGWEVVNGRMALGALIAFATYLGMAMGPVQTLLGVYMGFNRVRVSLDRVRHLTDARPDVEDTGLLPPPDRPPLIRLECVRFSHGSSEPVLRDVNLEIPPGSRVGLCGPSGSGKTTLADLLLRHFDPSSGRILLEGIHTQIGERGARLSGGERQRLAIARALLQDPLLLILDEATSALDPATEKELLDALDGLFPGVTRLVVSHREKPLEKADILLELRDGELRRIDP
jgi:ATP-binding cassette subfamily B protein